jgi:glycosyltransferase involved in cell wall biosynthesis
VPEIAHGNELLDVSVLLPAFNEESAIAGVIVEIRSALRNWKGKWEIVVVDDGSTDSTAERAEASGVRVLRRNQNGGSGVARLTGILAARGAVVAMLDADGSYDPITLPTLLSFVPEYDQVNGARTSEQGRQKLLRVPTKWAIRKIAEWVSGTQIPDLNTGMKVFKRHMMNDYLWLLPTGFSCVTTMTLAFLYNDHRVKYVDVKYRQRMGRSKFRPIRDSLNYVWAVLRVTLYFRPSRIIIPIGVGVVLAYSVLHGYKARNVQHVGVSDVLLFSTALCLLGTGLIARGRMTRRRRQRGGLCLGSAESGVPIENPMRDEK